MYVWESMIDSCQHPLISYDGLINWLSEFSINVKVHLALHFRGRHESVESEISIEVAFQFSQLREGNLIEFKQGKSSCRVNISNLFEKSFGFRFLPLRTIKFTWRQNIVRTGGQKES